MFEAFWKAVDRDGDYEMDLKEFERYLKKDQRTRAAARQLFTLVDEATR